MDVATTSLHPCVLVADDLDLYQRDRRAGGSTALGDLLQSLDSRPPDSRTMVMATTNDTSVFDRAAIRSGRLGDAVLEVDYPDRRACTRILESLLVKLPGGDDVDTGKVVNTLPDNTTGADLKSLTRRCVAISGGAVSTDALLSALTEGRYRTPVFGGHYL
jgi:ATP-dependent 26S proteasome regulatory subunit